MKPDGAYMYPVYKIGKIVQKSENIIWPGKTTYFGPRKPFQSQLEEEHLYHSI